MAVIRTKLQGLLLLRYEEKADERGFFKYIFQTSGIEGELLQPGSEDRSIAQINHSWSESNVLRGIHVEPWSKLVYVVAGRARLVVVDLRPESATYADWLSVDVGDFTEGRIAVYIPEGFGNGFYTFERTHYLNCVSSEFQPEGRFGVKWDDPSLMIDWGNKQAPIVSPVDDEQPSLSTFEMQRATKHKGF
jgi:dTDP-4-dehydrorhamnose 3,5-epimerase